MTEERKTADFTITKTEPDKMLVFGWANVAIRKDGTQVEDLQGDVIDPEELEKAAYDHVLRFRSTGERHDPNLRSKGRLIESCVFTKEKQAAMGIPPGILDEAWWVGYKIDDPEAWAKIKSGAYQMFSVEGKGKREAIAKSYAEAKEALQNGKRRLDCSGRSNKIVVLFRSGTSAFVRKYAPDQLRDRRGRWTEQLTGGGESGTLHSSQKISATGANRFEKGFSEKNLARHWKGGSSDHSGQYPGFTKEQYAQRALELVQQPVGGNIHGYKTAKGQVVRYDSVTNDYVVGIPKKGIGTMFKPSSGKRYFDRLKERDGT